MSIIPDNIGTYVSDVMPRLDGVYIKKLGRQFLCDILHGNLLGSPIN